MRQILIIGAGRSASSLIQYLLDKSEKRSCTIGFIIGFKTNDHKNTTAIALDIYDNEQRKAIENADIVISMLPAHLHIEVEIVLCTKKSLVTASYVSDAMQELDEAAKQIIFS
jgi:saccharopine dehydrogenase-like NADP-dependent oxidoreductase